jgi:hypothetical protein
VTKAGVEHPEWISDVVALAGTQAGIKGEKPAAKFLRHMVGNPANAADLQEDSKLMMEHKERIASDWSPNTSLHLISPTSDILIPIQQGLKLVLPKGQKPEKRVVVPRFVPDSWSRRGLRIPADAELIQNAWLPADHFNIAMIPAVISYVRNVRREAAGNLEETKILSGFVPESLALAV